MTDASEQERLEALEQATREYAQRRNGGGWAWLVGAAVLAIDVLHGWFGTSNDWVPVEMACGGAVWLWALRRSRVSYQQRGIVVPVRSHVPGREIALAGIYLMLVTAMAELLFHARTLGGRPALILAYAVSIAALPGLYHVAALAAPTWNEAYATYLVFWLPQACEAVEPSQRDGAVGYVFHVGFLLGVAAIACWMAVTGVTQHRAFRCLQRRLDGLRLAHPGPEPEGDRP